MFVESLLIISCLKIGWTVYKWEKLTFCYPLRKSTSTQASCKAKGLFVWITLTTSLDSMLFSNHYRSSLFWKLAGPFTNKRGQHFVDYSSRKSISTRAFHKAKWLFESYLVQVSTACYSAIITDHLLFENWLDHLQMREDNILLIILQGKVLVHKHSIEPNDCLFESYLVL